MEVSGTNFLVAISTLQNLKKKIYRLLAYIEDITEHLFNHSKSKFLVFILDKSDIFTFYFIYFSSRQHMV